MPRACREKGLAPSHEEKAVVTTPQGQNVWLPHLGVWAMAGAGAHVGSSLHTESSCASQEAQLVERLTGKAEAKQDMEEAGRTYAVPHRPAIRVPGQFRSDGKDRCTAIGEIGQPSAEEQLESSSRYGRKTKEELEDMASHGAACLSPAQSASCPICLSTLEQESKAVLQSCLHAFCVRCIEQWSRLKRFCPLCKRIFTGWLYNIRADDKYSEKVLPEPEHKLLAGSTSGSIVDPSISWAYNVREPWRYTWQRRRTPRGQQHHQRRHDQSQSGPRPYFFRLQRGLRSAETSGAAPRSAALPEQRSFVERAPRGNFSGLRPHRPEALRPENVIGWRRSIYDSGLRALPLDLPGRSTLERASPTGPPLHLAEPRHLQRLEAWIRRDLEALLGEADSLLVHLALGLWTSYMRQLAPSHPSAKSGTSKTGLGVPTAASAAEATAVKELERFLGSRAALFWHELRSFALSPFTMQAYDSVVRYPDCSVEPQAANQHPTPPSSSVVHNNRHYSRCQPDGVPPHNEHPRDGTNLAGPSVEPSVSVLRDGNESGGSRNDGGAQIGSHCEGPAKPSDRGERGASEGTGSEPKCWQGAAGTKRKRETSEDGRRGSRTSTGLFGDADQERRAADIKVPVSEGLRETYRERRPGTSEEGRYGSGTSNRLFLNSDRERRAVVLETAASDGVRQTPREGRGRVLNEGGSSSGRPFRYGQEEQSFEVRPVDSDRPREVCQGQSQRGSEPFRSGRGSAACELPLDDRWVWPNESSGETRDGEEVLPRNLDGVGRSKWHSGKAGRRQTRTEGVGSRGSLERWPPGLGGWASERRESPRAEEEEEEDYSRWPLEGQ